MQKTEDLYESENNPTIIDDGRIPKFKELISRVQDSNREIMAKNNNMYLDDSDITEHDEGLSHMICIRIGTVYLGSMWTFGGTQIVYSALRLRRMPGNRSTKEVLKFVVANVAKTVPGQVNRLVATTFCIGTVYIASSIIRDKKDMYNFVPVGSGLGGLLFHRLVRRTGMTIIPAGGAAVVGGILGFLISGTAAYTALHGLSFHYPKICARRKLRFLFDRFSL